MQGPELPHNPNPPVSLEDLLEILHNKTTPVSQDDEVKTFGQNMLEPEQPAFVWLQEGSYSSCNQKGTYGWGVEYTYKELFPDRPSAPNTTHYSTGLNLPTIGIYKTKSQNDWRVDELDIEENEPRSDRTNTYPNISWTPIDYDNTRAHMCREERDRLISHFLRPPKDVETIQRRQETFGALSTSEHLDEYVALKHGAYEALVGLRTLFLGNDDEWPAVIEHAFGSMTSAIVGDWDRIGEYNIPNIIREGVELINHGFAMFSELTDKLRAAGFAERLRVPSAATIAKQKEKISNIIALDGSDKPGFAIIKDDEQAGDQAREFVETCYELLKTRIPLGHPLR